MNLHTPSPQTVVIAMSYNGPMISMSKISMIFQSPEKSFILKLNSFFCLIFINFKWISKVRLCVQAPSNSHKNNLANLTDHGKKFGPKPLI